MFLLPKYIGERFEMNHFGQMYRLEERMIQFKGSCPISPTTIFKLIFKDNGISYKTLTNYVLNILQIFACSSSTVCLMIVIFNSPLMSTANFQSRCGAICQKTHLHTMALIVYRFWLHQLRHLFICHFHINHQL